MDTTDKRFLLEGIGTKIYDVAALQYIKLNLNIFRD